MNNYYWKRLKDNIHVVENCMHACVAEKTTFHVFIH